MSRFFADFDTTHNPFCPNSGKFSPFKTDRVAQRFRGSCVVQVQSKHDLPQRRTADDAQRQAATPDMSEELEAEVVARFVHQRAQAA